MRVRLSNIVAIVSLAMLSGCATTSHVIIQSHTVIVSETTWGGPDSDGDYCKYYFNRNGDFYYKSPTGFWKNGTWKQEGNKIYMEQNNKYSEYEGIIYGNIIKGNACNVEGHIWMWSATLR